MAAAEWNWAFPLPAPRWYPGCCTCGEYLYVTGGEQAGPQRTVWYAHVQPDGSLDSWLSTTTLPSGRMYHGCVAYSGYIYVAGGYGAGSYRNTVWYAEIHADGSIGSWVTTTGMPAARDGIGCVAHDGYVYVIGGYDGGSDHRTVWFAPIQGDGSLGLWETTTSMPAVRRCHGASAHNGYLYVTGGFTMGAIPTAHDDVWFAEIQADGSIDAWVSTASLPDAIYGHPCCAHDGSLLVTGGQTAFSYFSTAWSGEIQGDGSVGSWSSLDDLPESRTGHGSCVCRDHLYVIGGVNGSGNLGTVQYMQVGSAGGVEIDPLAQGNAALRLRAMPNIVTRCVQVEYQLAPAHGEGVIPVNLSAYDASGRLVRALVNEGLAEGTYRAQWRPGKSGMYLLKLSTPSATETEKILAIR